MFARISACGAFVAVAFVTVAGSPSGAQTPASMSRYNIAAPDAPTARDSTIVDVDSLVARALAVNPTLRVAHARMDAARARAVSAGARPDPTVMAGVQNFPVSRPGFSDFMTMKMVGVSQTIPFPGKLRLLTAAARWESDGARASLTAARLDVARQVRDAYYDLAYAEHALTITARNQRTLMDLVRVTQGHYTVGTGTQADVLRAQLETARLAQEASVLEEDRRAALARLNVLLDRPSGTSIGAIDFPSRIARLATPANDSAVHFASATLGARVADSPLLPLDSLQVLATQSNPMLRSHEAMVAAQRERVALARRATLPDMSVSVEYGQRAGLPDMVTALVSVPLPLQHARKQGQDIAAANAELTALEGEHHEQLNALDATLAARYSDAERARTQIALNVSAILPQARATLASTAASFQVGRAGLSSVIDTQAIVFNAEIAYYRALADFGKAVAALEQLAGTEVVR